MNDLRATIVPKSDQINADDLIGQTMTITITKVSLTVEADQPVALNFENDNGKAFKPCKSMRRVLVQVWGPDGNQYIGRRMTLYRDPGVKFGGMDVGGIRISHMSHIDRPVTMALTATRATRKPFTVQPLTEERSTRDSGWDEFLGKLETRLSKATSLADVEKVVATSTVQQAMQNARNGTKKRIEEMLSAARERFSDDDGKPPTAQVENDPSNEAEEAY